MRLLMDADCLIKLTKAGLKELICAHEVVSIPDAVFAEVVIEGKARGFADATVVERNIEVGKVAVVRGPATFGKGDEALLETFRSGGFDAVASDDTRLLRRLRSAGIPCALPAILLYRLHSSGVLDRHEVEVALIKLAAFISEDEYASIMLLLERDP